MPIETAPRDGTVVLVNDTTGLTRWCAAYWLQGGGWQGWVYDDDISLENNPGGPRPTHYMIPDELP